VILLGLPPFYYIFELLILSLLFVKAKHIKRIIWIGRANHLDWQGESSGLAGQSKILNDRM
jgi:hypothetical protein